jgi:hypothetical protein
VRSLPVFRGASHTVWDPMVAVGGGASGAPGRRADRA